MAEEKKHQLTAEGYQKLEDEKNNLIVNRRKEIAEKISEARAQGDLSENAEYDAAKEEQKHIEARIEEIEKILKNAEVIDEDEYEAGTVGFNTEVTVLDMGRDEEVTYRIVGSTEANILQKKISNESPLGSALMRKKVGDVVTVEAPNGEFEYMIKGIKKI